MSTQTVMPLDINQVGPRELEIRWADGHRSLYCVFDLRVGCPCANCVDEWTGQMRVKPADVPDDVHPLHIESVGRYGIKIDWSDGHHTGIYAYQYLRAICGCEICQLNSGASEKEHGNACISIVFE